MTPALPSVWIGVDVGGTKVLAGVVDELGAWSEQPVPRGKFTANAAWLMLAVMAFNLTRAAATFRPCGRSFLAQRLLAT